MSYQLLGRGKGGEARRALGWVLGWVGARRGRGTGSLEPRRSQMRKRGAGGREARARARTGGSGWGSLVRRWGRDAEPAGRGARTGSAARRGAGEGGWTGVLLDKAAGRGSVAGDTCAFGDGVSPCPVSSFCVFFFI